MIYKNVILYYFSGTGNALTAARWIKNLAEQSGRSVKIVPIDNGYKPDPDDLTDDTLIGFFYPTHGFNAAPTMLEFIRKFPRGKNPVFLVNTRAGTKIFRWAAPGVSGSAQLLPVLILASRGYSIRGGLPLDMPSNWISVHPALTDSAVRFIVDACNQRVVRFFEQLITGRRLLRRITLELIIDLPLLPVTIAYYLFGRFYLAKTFIPTHECDGCSVCYNHCPAGAITLVRNRPYWKYNCESCMRCISFCPRKAIQSSHLIFFGGLFVAFYPTVQYLQTLFFPELGAMNEWLAFTINNLSAMALVYGVYPLIHRILPASIVGRFFKYTSLTAYWRRYRAPGVHITSFKKP